MKIALGSDHAGFELKQAIERYLKKNRIPFRDFGTDSKDSCDYPDFAFPVARSVAAGKFDRGILICGSGVGVTITANRVKGIRAVNAYNLYIAKQSREHGDSNVLCLAGRKMKGEKALKILEAWLKTPFSGEKRHLRRIRKIDQR
jgi:ribose 5-phosphate isomerase B